MIREGEVNIVANWMNIMQSLFESQITVQIDFVSLGQKLSWHKSKTELKLEANEIQIQQFDQQNVQRTCTWSKKNNHKCNTLRDAPRTVACKCITFLGLFAWIHTLSN